MEPNAKDPKTKLQFLLELPFIEGLYALAYYILRARIAVPFGTALH